MKNILFAIIAFFALATPSYASVECHPTHIIHTDLAETYNEVVINSVVLTSTTILEVFASNNNVTWSIVIVDLSEGRACMVDYGGGTSSLLAAVDLFFGPPM
jgi:hypothetical protein